ncbi:MAG: multi-sensor hybrid histidine kinase [Thermoleophilia bacterium]|nr:multi-sensor hybrid histidine kinase [Thermoleophilia bacterium]
MNGPLHDTDVDAEGVIVVVRWLAVAFAVVQTATYYRPFPSGVEEVAWAVNGIFATAALMLTITWARTRSEHVHQAPVIGVISLVVDGGFSLALSWIYAFDVETAIFATMYIIALEGAFRFGMRGALLTTAALTAGYVARDVWATSHYGTEFLVASISFRMGVCLMLAVIAGGMVERYNREHRRLMVAIASERDAATALRSLDDLRSTFLSAVSHELRTPLTSILGFALTMQDQSDELSPTTRAMLDHVVSESRHLERLLEDLLDIERMGRGSVSIQRRSTDVSETVRRIVSKVQSRVGRRIDVDDHGTRVMGIVDGGKLERIVDNLVGNAVKYSPESSTVYVHVTREGGGVLMVVDDEGPGVPEELRTTIFQPFERGLLTSAHQPGTGIGLSLVDRFARLHGGRAWVESRNGSNTTSGASFRVYLPDGPEGQATVTVADEPWGPTS